VVSAIGEGMHGLEIGNEVFGMNDWFSDGAMAEYCVAPADAVAPKPLRVSHLEAAATPIGALTAWQGLFDRAKLQPRERVLVHGGAGAVGIFAVQLAKLHGGPRNRDCIWPEHRFRVQVGADQVIDYRTARFEECVKELDVVFDAVGSDTLQRTWGILKSNGRMVTIAASGKQATDMRARQAFFIVAPNQKQLLEVGNLLETGRLRAFVDGVVPLSQAPEIYTGRFQRQGHGKIVVHLVNIN
jgi:NADPH:quinone reductase-like Zn-dependent oxidoreductase